MSVTISPIALFNVANGTSEDAELWMRSPSGSLLIGSRMGSGAVSGGQTAEQRWRGSPGLQSRHWDWRRKTEALQRMLAHPGFSIVCAGVTQA
jgi:hypothetical protein